MGGQGEVGGGDGVRGGRSPSEYRMNMRQVQTVNGEHSLAWLEKKKVKVSCVLGFTLWETWGPHTTPPVRVGLSMLRCFGGVAMVLCSLFL